MSKEWMTPRERWLAVLKREQPDRIPMDYWSTPEATSKLAQYLGCQESSSGPTESWLSPWGTWVAGSGMKSGGYWSETYRALMERLQIDAVVAPLPAYKGPSFAAETDIFGCRYQDIGYGSGIYSECIYFPLAQYDTVEEIKKNYAWPDLDWFDYSTIHEQIWDKEQYPISAGGSEPFLMYQYLRGREQSFIDLVENPEIVHYCLEKLFDLSYENTCRIFEQIPGKAVLSYIAEDFGTQEHLLLSLRSIREFMLPGMKRMIDLVHQAGAYVFFHSDGAVRDVLPDMVAAGIDILNPVQWRCRGMDRAALKRDFGGKIIFHGGVDNQHTLVFGSIEDVQEEVRYNLETLGAGGGYILAPCHNIQVVSRPENVVAMYAANLMTNNEPVKFAGRN
jgi:uroporphyrinogen decarboxylase